MLPNFYSLTKGSSIEELLPQKCKHFIRKNKYAPTRLPGKLSEES
jgi:hypothetical protein